VDDDGTVRPTAEEVVVPFLAKMFAEDPRMLAAAERYIQRELKRLGYEVSIETIRNLGQ
jgi:DNA phosphorothioation-dependent restriction protein DptG